MLRRAMTISNERGLHARAAAKVTKLAESFQAELRISYKDNTVTAGSLMGLLMLGAAKGAVLEVSASGADAAQALDALQSLIDRKFDEE